ncbi:MAG: Lrp/AsnC family transcriptional regulator, partial [Thermomicrobia bacterium]|nr:Lrp/AsnC family transcriptional regulator [Thermomicrobia bacterium]MCA1724876.1 Lrp/AsnC family transcriptional regulator [Thermomicrobia bacterium]
MEEVTEPDALDWQLIRLLQEDGRRPTAAIARDVGLPEATVRRRIDRLIREKTIQIVAVADDEKLGLALHMLIGVQIDLQQVEAIGGALCALPEVRWVGMTTGPYDYVIEAFFHSTRHFHDFLTRVIAYIPGVKRTESLTVLS